MIQSNHNSIVLKKSNQVRLNALFSQFSKGQPNTLKFSQYMMFMLDRCVISNRLSLSQILSLFSDTIANRPTKKEDKDNPQFQGKQIVVAERTITKDQLINIINELGKIMYHNDPNFQDRIYNEVLSEKTIANKDSLEYPRLMAFDDTNRRFLTQNSVRVLCQYEDDLKSLFVIYINENYNAMKKSDRILLNQRQICLQNKKMTAVSFLRFIKQAEIVPHLINIEHVQQCISRVVPPTVTRESEFFYKHFLIDVYSKDIEKFSQIKHDGDPGLLFFEFQFVLARMSWDIYRDTDKKQPQNMLRYLLSKYLYIKPNDEPNMVYPVTQKAHLNKLITYHQKYQVESSEEGEEQQDEEELGRGFITNKQNQLMNLPPCQLDIVGTLKSLDKELPEMPPDIEIKQEFPPPFPFDIKPEDDGKKKKKKKDKQPTNDKIIIGQQPPPPPVDKNKQGAAKPQARKQMRKPGEPIPRVFAWRQQPEYPIKSQDYLQKLAAELDNELKPLSSIERGVMNVEPLPCIISEILYPPEVPQPVVPYLEAAINSHNEGNFFSALDNYKKAQDQWKKIEALSSNIDLFFQYTKATVYVSAGHDDYALETFLNCKQFTDSSKMQYLSPDRALPWCGIGETCYNTEEYELSARAFLKARQIRQPLLGIQSVDTATTMNNLGCCFFMLDRNKQALSYFKICYAIFQSQLGTFHQRTQTAFSNLKKSQRGEIEQIPAYRKLWEVYEKDPFGKKKKKKKKGKK